MHHPTIGTLVAALLLVSSPTLAAPGETAVTSSTLVGRADELMAKTETALKAGDIDNASVYVRALRAIAVVGSSLPATLVPRIWQLRKAVATAGGTVESWDMWGYDGQAIGSWKGEVADVEGKIANLRVSIAKGDIPGADKQIYAVEHQLAGPDWAQVSVLKRFHTELASPALTGIGYQFGTVVVERMGGLIRDAQRRMGKRETAETLTAAREALDLYRLVEAHRVQNGPYAVELTDGKVTLTAALDVTASLVKQATNTAAADKAEEAVKLARWKAVLSGERARLFGEMGPPHEWDVTADDSDPADAAKASWWSYSKVLKPHVRQVTTYRFDRRGALVATDKSEEYIPQ